MHSFSIADIEGNHCGFVVIDAHNEQVHQGSLIFKIQALSEAVLNNPNYIKLNQLPSNQSLNWLMQQEQILIYDTDALVLAKIKGPYLYFKDDLYLLNDLTGMI